MRIHVAVSTGSKAVFKQQNLCSVFMKFTCHLNVGLGRRHWSMRRDETVFRRNKLDDVEEAPRFWVSFYVFNVIFKRF